MIGEFFEWLFTKHESPKVKVHYSSKEEEKKYIPVRMTDAEIERFADYIANKYGIDENNFTESEIRQAVEAEGYKIFN
jgi:hypothetical protein